MKIVKVNQGDILKLKKTEPVMYWFDEEMRLSWIDEYLAEIVPFDGRFVILNDMSFFSQTGFNDILWEQSSRIKGGENSTIDFIDGKRIYQYHENS